MKIRILSPLCLAMGLGLSTQAATAGSADVPLDSVITAEILPGWETPDGTQMAGLRLTLAPGWKTYWRAPGEAGIPPRFNWTGSTNMAAVQLHWPRPEVFYQNGMRTIGYKHEVVLPLELTPTDPSQPISMSGHVDLGVCLDICMPMALELHATLPSDAQPAPIRAALDARPASGQAAGVGTVTCTTAPIDDGMRLTARITVPPLGAREVAVVELSDPSIWVAEAKVTRDGDALTAVTDLVPVNAQPFALDGANVRITLLSGANAIDIAGCAVN
ncbi:protein-disulfide reductase DsbD domain-containing protein [Actibacterium sp. D379-3]